MKIIIIILSIFLLSNAQIGQQIDTKKHEECKFDIPVATSNLNITRIQKNKIQALTDYQILQSNLERYDQKYNIQFYNSSFAFLDTYILEFTNNTIISKSEARFMIRNFNKRGKYIFKSLANPSFKQKIIDGSKFQIIKDRIQQVKEDFIVDNQYQNSPYMIQQMVQNVKFQEKCQVFLINNSKQLKSIFLGCHNENRNSKNLQNKIKAAITYTLLATQQSLKIRQPQIIEYTFLVNEQLQPFLKSIESVEIQDLDPDYYVKNKNICKLAKRKSDCQTLLDTKAGLNFIYKIQDDIDVWKVPKINKVKYNKLFNPISQEPLNKITSFHSNKLQSLNVVGTQLKKRGLQHTSEDQDIFRQDLIYSSTMDFQKKKHFTSQLTYSINQKWVSNLSDKFKMINSIKRFDQKKLYGSYDSSYLNPLQFQIDFRNLSKPLSKDEIKVLSLENKGMWILKPAQGMQGFGIELVYNLKDVQDALILKRDFQELSQKLGLPKLKQQQRYFTLQKYIENPLLQNNKKFDARQFILVLSSDPLIVVYQTGYTRKTMIDYDRFSPSKFVHLGNGDIQKKIPGYKKKVQNDHNYLRNEFKNKLIKEYPQYTEEDFDEMEEKIKAGVTYCIEAALDQYPNVRKGDTEIIAIDMVMDDNLNPFITEFNRNPYLGTSQKELKKLFPVLGKSFADATLALHAMDHDEIIARSRQNPYFVCDLMPEIYDCKNNLLINDAVDYSILDYLDLQSYKQPQYKIYEEKDVQQYYQEKKIRKQQLKLQYEQ